MSLIDTNYILDSNEQIVQDHLKLAELCNDLHKLLSMDQDKHPDVSEITVALKKLIDHFVEHAAEEERIMQELKYPSYQSHKEHHDELITALNKMYDDYVKENNHQILIDFMGTVLKSWHNRHLSFQDNLLSQFISNKHCHLSQAKDNA
jgi:hemerythrin